MRHFRSLLWTQTFLLCFGSALAEESPASGRVVDAQGKPVSGTTVRLVQENTPVATSDKAYPPQLSGTVVDTSGAVIAGATVQVRSANGTSTKNDAVGQERLLHHFWTRGR